MGSKRGPGYDAGLGSAVLTAPVESYASETETRGSRRGGPAPAGALQRGYASDDYEDAGAGGAYAHEEAEYVPRRGKLRLRYRGLPRSVGGRIVLGALVFGVLAAVAVAGAGVRYYLMHDSRFVLATTDDIQINGAEHLTRDQVLTVFGADLERNIFRVPLAERQTDLERLPWVAHAAVMRLLPDVLRVQITERTPVAFVRQGTQIGLVDASGVLLDMPPDAAGDPHYSFPVLTGLSADETMPERAAKMAVYQQFMKDLDSAGQHLTDSVSEVDVSDPEDVKALITSGSSDILVHFGQEQFLKRYQEFEQHLAEWKQQYPKLASADMRYEGQIVLEMQGDGDATVAGGGSTAGPAVEDATATAKATTTAKTNTGVLRLRAARSAQDDGEKQTTATAKVVTTGTKATTATKATTMAKTTTTAKAGSSAVLRNGSQKAVVARAKMPVARKFVAKRVVGKPRPGSGIDAANARVFARLAAAHRAALAKEHKAELAKVAKNGRARGKSGVTP